MVPKSRPMSHWVSEIGVTMAQDLVGSGARREIEVADRPPEEGVPHRAADQGELVARRREGARESFDDGRGCECVQSLHCGCHAVHSALACHSAVRRTAAAGVSGVTQRRAHRLGPMPAERFVRRRPGKQLAGATGSARGSRSRGTRVARGRCDSGGIHHGRRGPRRLRRYRRRDRRCTCSCHARERRRRGDDAARPCPWRLRRRRSRPARPSPTGSPATNKTNLATTRGRFLRLPRRRGGPELGSHGDGSCRRRCRSRPRACTRSR